MSERLKIGKQIEKSLVPYSIVITGSNNEQMYMSPTGDGFLYYNGSGYEFTNINFAGDPYYHVMYNTNGDNITESYVYQSDEGGGVMWLYYFDQSDTGKYEKITTGTGEFSIGIVNVSSYIHALQNITYDTVVSGLRVFTDVDGFDWKFNGDTSANGGNGNVILRFREGGWHFLSPQSGQAHAVYYNDGQDEVAYQGLATNNSSLFLRDVVIGTPSSYTDSEGVNPLPANTAEESCSLIFSSFFNNGVDTTWEFIKINGIADDALEDDSRLQIEFVRSGNTNIRFYGDGSLSTDEGITRYRMGAYSVGAPAADGYLSWVINGEVYQILVNKA